MAQDQDNLRNEMVGVCDFIWPSNNKKCGGQIVSTHADLLKAPGDDGYNSWIRLGGPQILKTAMANPGRFICRDCGELVK